MALEFKKLSEVTAVEEISDAAKFLVEDNGEIKRVSKETVSGGPAAGIVVFTLFGDEGSCSHTFAELAEMYDNLTLSMVCFTEVFGGRYYFNIVNNLVPYDSGDSTVNIGDAANNAKYFLIGEFLKFFKDGTIISGAPE